MNSPSLVLCAVTLCVLLPAQQPNSPFASLTVDGNAGPPNPVTINVRNNTTATIAIGGVPNSPFALYGSATGLLTPGAATTPGGIVDLPLAPLPFLAIDGFANPAFTTGTSGVFTLPIAIPQTVAVGFSAAQQCVVASAFTAGGFRLSAATREIVTQGPVTVNLSVGDDTSTAVSLVPFGFTVPFYGTSYTSVYLCSNGFATLGGPDNTFAASLTVMNSGLPRVAGFWADLIQNAGQSVSYTVDANPGPGVPQWIQFSFSGISEFALPSTVHTFSMYLDANGLCQITESGATAGPAIQCIVGIGAGGNTSALGSRDLTVLQAAVTLGAVNDPFFELFATPGNAYDLFGRTLSFLPSGTGALPGSTNRYVIY